jgi:hypothetical protein
VPTDKPNCKPISMSHIATIFYRDDEHNNEIKIDNLDGKQVLDNTRRGDDGQHKASGMMDNTTRGGGWGTLGDKQVLDNMRRVT